MLIRNPYYDAAPPVAAVNLDRGGVLRNQGSPAPDHTGVLSARKNPPKKLARFPEIPARMTPT